MVPDREWIPTPEPREELLPAVASVALPPHHRECFGVKTDTSQAES